MEELIFFEVNTLILGILVQSKFILSVFLNANYSLSVIGKTLSKCLEKEHGKSYYRLGNRKSIYIYIIKREK
jgi:hypothetical protein